MTVRAATAADVDAIRTIAAVAGERFRQVDDPRIARCADDPPMTADEVLAYVDDGRAFVAVGDASAVVGFIVVDRLDADAAHVEEVSVHPDAQGAGHGTALLDAAARWATGNGFTAVTLTTFRDVPWNAPFYATRGYRVLAADELTPALGQRVADEASHGLDPDLRVVMRRELP